MWDLFLARPWSDVRAGLNRAGVPYEVTYTRSPRAFFSTDASQLYVVRIRYEMGTCAVTLAEAPAGSSSVAACEAEDSFA